MAIDAKRAAKLRGAAGGTVKRATAGQWIGRVALALVLGGLLGTSAGAAEPHRIEVVGIYPIRDAARGKINPRDEAIQQALWEGVSRVALELIGDQDVSGQSGGEADAAAGAGRDAGRDSDAGGPAADASGRFRNVLGREILPYTRSFRILEDRGERPVLFADQPGVRSEYLVVVEVLVDVARLRTELSRAGLLEPNGIELTRQRITIELIGLERHEGLRRVIETLRRELGASRIATLEFSPARQLLSIETALGPQEVASRLAAVEAPDLILDPAPVAHDARQLRVLAQWLPVLPAEAPEPADAGGTRTPPSAGR